MGESNRLDIHIHVHNHDQGATPAWAVDLSHKMEQLKETIMTAVDDLKSAMTDLITEATTDITQLITQINNQANSDPAVIALTAQVRQAIVDLHKGFTDATGVKLPPPPPPQPA